MEREIRFRSRTNMSRGVILLLLLRLINAEDSNPIVRLNRNHRRTLHFIQNLGARLQLSNEGRSNRSRPRCTIIILHRFGFADSLGASNVSITTLLLRVASRITIFHHLTERSFFHRICLRRNNFTGRLTLFDLRSHVINWF